MERKKVGPIEHRKPQTSFHLRKMQDLYIASGGKDDVPHRHDYYTVLLIQNATGNHVIDFNAYPFRARQAHFISPGQVHQVKLDDQPNGWFFTFSREFLAVNDIPEKFISNMNLFSPFGKTPPIQLDQQSFQRLTGIISEMQDCMPLATQFRERALGALLQLFLIYCHASGGVNSNQLDEENKSVCILRDFKTLVSRRYKGWHGVGTYASELHITPKHLSHTVKKLTGKTAKELIQDRLLLEAKRLLLHTDMSVKEIAYEIGYEEPLHFSSFFKKKSGVPPTSFRESAHA